MGGGDGFNSQYLDMGMGPSRRTNDTEEVRTLKEENRKLRKKIEELKRKISLLKQKKKEKKRK